MKKLLFLAVAATTLPAFAQPETYVVDPRHTFPSYEIGHNNYSFQRGRFNKTTGKITLDTQAKKGSADIVIDATSVSTGVEKLEEHIRSDDFLKTKAHPQITFKSNQFDFDGDKLKRVVGELTMAGVTRPVTLDATHFHCEPHKQMKVKVCGAELVGKIKRSEFGIVYGLPALSDEMTLRIGVEAREEKTPA
jgi:polyisoprenoid-binding protein YceI